MGMQSAQVQSGTQPQGKGFAQPVNPPAQGNLPQVMRQDGLDQNAINADPAGFQSWQQRRQAQQPQQMQSSQGKGSTTNAATSGQPTYGQPNNYPNTVGQWDNASIQRQSPTGGGKGKG
jgi:hypothetical protein